MLPTDWKNVHALHNTFNAIEKALSGLYKAQVPVTQVPEAFKLCQKALETLEEDADRDSLKVALDEAKAIANFVYDNTRALYHVVKVLCDFRLNPITKSTLLAIVQIFKEIFSEAKDHLEVHKELETEFTQFAAGRKNLLHKSSTQYWIAEGKTFKHLSKLALSIIAIPATTMDMMDIVIGSPHPGKIVELIKSSSNQALFNADIIVQAQQGMAEDQSSTARLEEGDENEIGKEDSEGDEDDDEEEDDDDDEGERSKDILSWCRKNLLRGDQVLVRESWKTL